MQSTEFGQVRFYRVLIVLWFGYAGYTMARRPFSVARADIQNETGLSVTASATVDAAFLTAYTVLQLLYGSWIKGRWSSHRILVMGLFGSAVCCFALSYASSAHAFVIAWGLNGAFQATGWAACMTIITPWIQAHERGYIMGIWGTNMAVGGIAGNVVTAFLIGRGVSWRNAVAADAVILVVIVVIVATALVPHPNKIGVLTAQQAAAGMEQSDLRQGATRSIDGEVSVTTVGGAAQGTVSSASVPLRETIAFPGVLDLGISYFFHKLVRYCLMFWLPFYLTTEMKFTAASAGYLASLLDVGGVLGTVVSGIASDNFRGGQRRGLVVLGFCTCMLLTLLFFTISSAMGANALLCSIGVFAIGVFSFAIDALLSGSYLQDYAERIGHIGQLGAISGFIGGLGAAGSIAQSFITVYLSSYSWSVVFLTMSLMTFMATCLMHRPLRVESNEAGKPRQTSPI